MCWAFGFMLEAAPLPVGTVLRTNVPSRLDRLQWSGWHWRVLVALAALTTELLLNPAYVPPAVGWRCAFLLGAVMGLAILIVRRDIPESPRWLLMHGHVPESERIVDRIESAVLASTGATRLPEA